MSHQNHSHPDAPDHHPLENDSADNQAAQTSSPAEVSPSGISRRGFLKGAGITAAGTALLEGIQVFSREAVASTTQSIREVGPGAIPMTFHVNGQEYMVRMEPHTTLAEALRNDLGLTGTKIVCDRGSCSGCTVLVNRVPVNSCMMLAIDASTDSTLGRGKQEITTIEGLSTNGELHPLQAAFVQHDAMQCGFCTPGMVMSCAALLEHTPQPTEADVRKAVSGNLCRCGTYPKVFAATLATAAAGMSTYKA